MKKFFIFFVFVMATVATALAQEFIPVVSVKKADKAFYAVTAADSYQITVAEYVAIKKSPNDYFIAALYGDNGFKVVVTKSEFTDEILVIDSVGIDAKDSVEVYFTNGKVHKTDFQFWLKAKKSQYVRHTAITGKRLFERYQTVSAEVAQAHKANVPVPSVAAPVVASTDTVPDRNVAATSEEVATTGSGSHTVYSRTTVNFEGSQVQLVESNTAEKHSSKKKKNSKSRTVNLPNGLVLVEK
jgi:hypothetical protein